MREWLPLATIAQPFDYDCSASLERLAACGVVRKLIARRL
jgi:hypothetical protein